MRKGWTFKCSWLDIFPTSTWHASPKKYGTNLLVLCSWMSSCNHALVCLLPLLFYWVWSHGFCTGALWRVEEGGLDAWRGDAALSCLCKFIICIICHGSYKTTSLFFFTKKKWIIMKTQIIMFFRNFSWWYNYYHFLMRKCISPHHYLFSCPQFLKVASHWV